MNHTEVSFWQRCAEERSKNPEATVDEIVSIVNRDLEADAADFQERVAGQARDQFSRVFERKGILNPRVLDRETDKDLHFIFVDGRGKYSELLEKVQEWEGDLTSYVVFGETDWILRLFGPREEMERLVERLEEWGFRISSPPRTAKEIPYFYRHEPQEYELNGHANNPAAIDTAVREYEEQSKLQSEVVQDLQECSVLLGAASIEDIDETRRFVSVIELDLYGTVDHGTDILATLRKELDSEAWGAVFNLFEVSPGKNYILEAIVSDIPQLDTLTDDIMDAFPDRAKPQTTSHIIAKKPRVRLPVFQRQRVVAPSEGAERFLDRMTDLERVVLHDEQLREYARNWEEQPETTRLLVQYGVGSLSAYRTEGMPEAWKEQLTAAIEYFVRGALEDSHAFLGDAIGRVYKLLEGRACRTTTRTFCEIAYGNMSYARSQLSLPEGDVDGWTLGESYHFFETWNEQSPYTGPLGHDFPESLIATLRDFYTWRSSFEHSDLPEEWKRHEDVPRRALIALEEGFQAAVDLATYQQEEFKKRFRNRTREASPDDLVSETVLTLIQGLEAELEGQSADLDVIREQVFDNFDALKRQREEIATVESEINEVLALLENVDDLNQQIEARLQDVDATLRNEVQSELTQLRSEISEGANEQIRERWEAVLDHQAEILEAVGEHKEGKFSRLMDAVEQELWRLPGTILGSFLLRIVLELDQQNLRWLVGLWG